MPSAIMECTDFSEFQEALKNLRKTDDIIINTINTVVPTDSFHADAATACKNLHESLEEGNIKREKYIKNCISVAADRVKRLREEREANAEDIQLRKELRDEQTKLRMLQVELSVEDLIKQRTAKVFNEKCRKYYKPL
ncbi:coiled-coil domain-containing protein 58 [Anoplophora glabripennis]|uniref:Protein MIX23 n=1 Tax=Anoplophora glabripennis TaxID=217634 RepID=V5I7X3_ANOGL|nr:coiled-coil domain-containing protein 58 [Anoplophora glabripennis]